MNDSVHKTYDGMIFFYHLGHGAYFADDLTKSHGYTNVLRGGNTCVMFYNKVLLGVQHELTQPNDTLQCATKGFHFVVGKHNTQTEYIVYPLWTSSALLENSLQDLTDRSKRKSVFLWHCFLFDVFFCRVSWQVALIEAIPLILDCNFILENL